MKSEECLASAGASQSDPDVNRGSLPKHQQGASQSDPDVNRGSLPITHRRSRTAMKPIAPCVPIVPGRDDRTPPLPRPDITPETKRLNDLLEQAQALSGERRLAFLETVRERYPAMHERLEQLLVVLDVEVPPAFLQANALSASVVETFYRRYRKHIARGKG